MLALLVLCVIPGYGALRLVPQGGLPVVALWYFGVSLLTFILYRHDKMRAGDGGWRIPETGCTPLSCSVAGPVHCWPSSCTGTRRARRLSRWCSGW
jgi:hypothetical protein